MRISGTMWTVAALLVLAAAGAGGLYMRNGQELRRLQLQRQAQEAKLKARQAEAEEKAAEARREGFADVAVLWENIARIEALHRDVFMQAYNELQTQSLYKKEQPVVWRCINCGFVTLANEPWGVCPVCGKDRGWVEGQLQQKKLPSA